MGQDNAIYKCSIKLSLSSKGQNKSKLQRKKEREMFYLTTHSTHFIYGYMASDIWLRTILIVRKETRCRHIGYSYRLTARVLLYTPSHRQDNTYHSLCYTKLFSKCFKILTIERWTIVSVDDIWNATLHVLT